VGLKVSDQTSMRGGELLPPLPLPRGQSMKARRRRGPEFMKRATPARDEQAANHAQLSYVLSMLCVERAR
jgi:hypothetical protein